MLSVLLAATFSLMEVADWEAGRFVETNGWFSVTGHGGNRHSRLTRESFIPVDGESVVFECEVLKPIGYLGNQNVEFWFACQDKEGNVLATARRVGYVKVPQTAESEGKWQKIKSELKALPKGTCSLRVGSAAGASKYEKNRPHTIIRNMRISGVLAEIQADGALTPIPSDAFETAVSLPLSREAKFRFSFAESAPVTVAIAPIKGGVKIEPFGLDYKIGAPKSITVSLRYEAGRARFYLDGNYIGSRRVGGRPNAVIDLGASSSVSFPTRPQWAKREFEYVNFDAFDLSKATKKNEELISLRAMTNSCVRTVACEQYTRAYVTCAADPDSKKDRAFTIRLSRYNDVKGFTGGRGVSSLAQTLVELDCANKTQVGTVELGGKKVPLWRVEVPLEMGQIPDIIFSDRRGTHLFPLELSGYGRYLDLELLGRTYAFHRARFDERDMPDAKFTSAITVYGVELEKSGCEMDFFQTVPGNVFADDEVPQTGVELRVKRPGEYTLKWRTFDAEGHPASSGARTVKADEKILVPLAEKLPGWYSLDFELYEGERKLLQHKASFALLGRDTRTSGRGEGPYIICAYFGSHYSCSDIDIVGQLSKKLGARRAPCNLGVYDFEKRAKWLISPADLNMIFNRHRSDKAKLKEAIAKSLVDDPHTKSLMIFHEGYPWAYCQAPEMTGQKPTDDLIWRTDKKESQHRRFTNAVDTVKFFRENFPQVKICMGNSLACTALIGNMIRDGFPESYCDYMGLEVLNRCTLPEKLGEANIQCADYMYETARAFGYNSWKVNNMWESNYRTAAIIGQDRAAAWYARDFVISHLWRFPDISLGNLEEVGNRYAAGFWGQAGHCLRNPYHYPKKSFVTTATATKMLDMVTDFRHIPTGDESVYAVEFMRRDGKSVTVFWTSNGAAPLEVSLAGRFETFDAYGRTFKMQSNRWNIFRSLKRYRFTADDWVRYIVAEPGAVKSARVCGERDYSKSWLRPPMGGRVAVDPKSAIGVKLKKDKEPLLEKTTGVFLPYRTIGKYELSKVLDETEGECWQLDLAKPDMELPKAIAEYAVVEFDKPIELEGDPGTIGMRVKGNAGFGSVHWVIEDAAGVRRISCGNSHGVSSDPYDAAGRTLLAFKGWNDVMIPISDSSSIYEEMIGSAEHQWQAGKIDKDGKCTFVGGPPKYPVKLVGFAFSAWNRPLFLEERKPYKQVVRFGRISTYDFAK